MFHNSEIRWVILSWIIGNNLANIYCGKWTIETLEKGMKYNQS